MEPVRITRGDSPLVLGMPHAGTHVPGAVRAALNDEGRVLRDTDWHIDRLYADLVPGATCVAATVHRYVIDANRDPTGRTLYPGRFTTGLVPLTTFDNVPIWRDGMEPGAADTARRLAACHAPYHAALAGELERVKARHGYAVLYDCHSIRSEIPWLFEGVLPDFNIGTDFGATCAPAIEAAARDACLATGRTTVVNGRFRGGWTTRHHGKPEDGIHAIQMELAQRTHLACEAPPFVLSPDLSVSLRPQLSDILQAILDAASTVRAGADTKGSRYARPSS